MFLWKLHPAGGGENKYGFISKECRDNLEQTADYNLYTYNTDGYKLTASGAFCDAVNFEKPVLAIRNEFFSYYFDKFGNIGYLFDNAEDMGRKIIEIAKHPDIREYQLQKENIKNIKKVMDINYIAGSQDFYG